MPTAQQHIKTMVQLIDSIPYVRRSEVFADFVEMAAIALSSATDLRQRDKREDRYLRLIGKYQPKHQAVFPQLFGELEQAMGSEPTDILGRLFHQLDAASRACGQFFTPYHVCELVASISIGDGSHIKAEIEERGFIRLSEPACGSAAMVIAFAEGMRKLGINYQEHLHVTLNDIDTAAVHMAFVHLSLLHIPAIVVHGNTLTLEEYGHWYTPAHVMGLFNGKLRRGYALDSSMGRGEMISEQPANAEAEEAPITTAHLLMSQAAVRSLTEQAALF